MPTDDWPFLYLREPGIATPFIVALGLVLVLAARERDAPHRAGSALSIRRFSPHFFLLGAAFLLLETRSLVSFGLLFGNTWVVNALVFFAILLSVLASIGVASVLPRRQPGAVVRRPCSCRSLLSWLIPPSALLIDPPWLRYAAAAALAFAPVFFANLCFTYSFRDSPAADMSFASNLLGAVVGGAIEYAALITGYQAARRGSSPCFTSPRMAPVRWAPRCSRTANSSVRNRSFPRVPPVPAAV